MAEDMLQLNDAMDMDIDNVVMTTVDETAADTSFDHYQLRSGRVIYRKHLKPLSIKPMIGAKTTRAHRRARKKAQNRKKRTAALDRNQLQQGQDAIANSNYLNYPSQISTSPSSTLNRQSDHFQRLTKDLVLQALFDQTPGLTIPAFYDSSLLGSAQMNDLLPALESYQTLLALQSNINRPATVAKLVKTFVQAILGTKSRLEHSMADIDTWDLIGNVFGSECVKM